MRTLFILLILGVFPFISSAQTPVVMANQSSGTYTENFADIANWANNFATGTGASAWGSVATNTSGTSGDGIKISTFNPPLVSIFTALREPNNFIESLFFKISCFHIKLNLKINFSIYIFKIIKSSPQPKREVVI